MAEQILEVPAADGTAVPVYWYPGERPGFTLLLLPALGIQARLYRKLAAQLNALGHAVALMEQRGHGESRLRPGYQCRYTFDDMLDKDIPAVIDWLRQRAPANALVMGGHSLGGHLSTIHAGRQPDQVAGILHLACAFPYCNDYPPGQRRLLRFLCAVMPLFKWIPGYYPGKLTGFGGRESIGMMMQWRQWARSGSFDWDDHTDVARAGRYTGPALAIEFERDTFATEAAISRAQGPLRGAALTRVSLGPAEQGDYLGHVDWARSPEGVSARIDSWLSAIASP